MIWVVRLVIVGIVVVMRVNIVATRMMWEVLVVTFGMAVGVANIFY
jgi:hypothetical protein